VPLSSLAVVVADLRIFCQVAAAAEQISERDVRLTRLAGA